MSKEHLIYDHETMSTPLELPTIKSLCPAGLELWLYSKRYMADRYTTIRKFVMSEVDERDDIATSTIYNEAYKLTHDADTEISKRYDLPRMANGMREEMDLYDQVALVITEEIVSDVEQDRLWWLIWETCAESGEAGCGEEG
ncbi:MAG: hypothetical protein KKB59_20230 [Spirochaetes bacterium]|nr:hypothetical protein [Spirochaetota bacterium]